MANKSSDTEWRVSWSRPTWKAKSGIIKQRTFTRYPRMLAFVEKLVAGGPLNVLRVEHRKVPPWEIEPDLFDKYDKLIVASPPPSGLPERTVWPEDLPGIADSANGDSP